MNYRQIKYILKNQRGFTMVEMLLYMGIFSILLVVLLQVFGGIVMTHIESQATSSVDQDGNYILARLTYDIHNSSTVGGSNCTWSTGSPTPCTLVLDTSSYSALGNNLSLTEGGVTDVLNSTNTNIKSITFTTIGNTAVGSKQSVQISLALKSTVQRQGGVFQTQTFQTTVETR